MPLTVIPWRRKHNPSIAPTSASYRDCMNCLPATKWSRRSLAGVADAIAPGGYSGVHRPALAPAARNDCPCSHQPPPGAGLGHAPAHQAEMDQLVEAAGFTKITQRIDEWGIFTVSLAVRRAQGPLRTRRRNDVGLAKASTLAPCAGLAGAAGPAVLSELRLGQPPGQSVRRAGPGTECGV
jgi:hypothetical protein